MRALLLAPVVLLLGCESVDDVVKAQRPAVEKTFVALRALQEKVERAPHFDQAAVKAAPEPVRLSGESSNAVFIYAEDLAKPGTPADVPLRTLDSRPVLDCGAVLEKGQLFNDTVTRVSPSLAKGTLEVCARLRYALVIRLVQYVRPELSLETKQFAPGRYAAEVLVFDLATQTLLGGFPVFATNDSRVSLLDGDENHVVRLIGNLESATFDALRARATATLKP